MSRRQIGRRLQQHQPRETRAAQTNPRHATPRNRALGIQAFEVRDQQEPEVAAGRRPWASFIRVESLAEALDVPVEVMLTEDLI